MNAEILMLIGGTAVFLFTAACLRARGLRAKYALLWLTIAAGLLVLGAFPRILMQLAEWAQLSYPAAVLFLALGVIYVFGFSVSLSLSRLHRRNLRLTQEFALLEQRVRKMEETVFLSSGRQSEQDESA